MGGKDGQARVLKRDQAHQGEAVRPLAAHLLGVDPRRLITVMAVGDQQLGIAEGLFRGLDRILIVHAPEAIHGPVVVGGLGPRRCFGERRQRAPDGFRWVGEQREDRGQVGLRRAGQPEPVLFGPRVGSLVGADPAGAVVSQAHAREEAATSPTPAVGPGVLLGKRPHCRLPIGDQHRLLTPPRELDGGVLVRVTIPPRQVDAHDVIRRTSLQRRALLGVDHVVRGCDHVLQAAGLDEVVMERAQRFDFGHRRPSLLDDDAARSAEVRPEGVRTYVRGRPGDRAPEAARSSQRTNRWALVRIRWLTRLIFERAPERYVAESDSTWMRSPSDWRCRKRPSGAGFVICPWGGRDERIRGPPRGPCRRSTGACGRLRTRGGALNMRN